MFLSCQSCGFNDALVPAPSSDQRYDPTIVKGLAIGGAVVGGLAGGWIGKKVGWAAGAIGGALSLGLLTWAYFSNRLGGQ